MNKVYTISQFAKRVNKGPSTLRRWDTTGKLVAKRTMSGHRYYDESDVRTVLKLPSLEKRKIVVYCRVSSKAQSDDLKSQVNAMNDYCINSGQSIDEFIKEIGGGMNFKRKEFLNLLKEVIEGNISKIIIAHKDRLCRFGFDLFNYICEINDCTLEVVNQEKLSPEKEMVDDLLSIVHTFSCRLYGLSSYKKQIKEYLK